MGLRQPGSGATAAWEWGYGSLGVGLRQPRSGATTAWEWGYSSLRVGLPDGIHSTGQLEPWTKHCKSVSFIVSSCPLLLRMHTT